MLFLVPSLSRCSRQYWQQIMQLNLVCSSSLTLGLSKNGTGLVPVLVVVTKTELLSNLHGFSFHNLRTCPRKMVYLSGSVIFGFGYAKEPSSPVRKHDVVKAANNLCSKWDIKTFPANARQTPREPQEVTPADLMLLGMGEMLDSDLTASEFYFSSRYWRSPLVLSSSPLPLVFSLLLLIVARRHQSRLPELDAGDSSPSLGQCSPVVAVPRAVLFCRRRQELAFQNLLPLIFSFPVQAKQAPYQNPTPVARRHQELAFSAAACLLLFSFQFSIAFDPPALQQQDLHCNLKLSLNSLDRGNSSKSTMDDSSSTAAIVAQAIAAALDLSSPLDSRKAAVVYLESVKTGNVRTLASTSLILVRKDWPLEIRLHAFKMLQHLVRFRWDELSISERREFASLTINIVSEAVNPQEEWALKSQTAVLVAEVVRREGIELWRELLPNLVCLSIKGPLEAELVAMVLTRLPEDITVHNEDLEGDRRRVLLRGLTETLTEILPLLYTLLEKHFGAALREYTGQQFDAAKQHASTVIASLNAVNAYAEWAPVPDLAKYGLIHGCGSLLSYSEFRLNACEFFKFICQRKRPTDNTAVEFDSAMVAIFRILMNVSRDFLNRSRSNITAIDETEFEFAECLCDCMVSLASSNMQCIIDDGVTTTQFLQQMLKYYQHFKFSLHFQSLLFWLALMREPTSKVKAAGQCGGDNSVGNPGIGSRPIEKDKKGGVSAFINDDICADILDISFLRMLKKNPSATNISTTKEFELWDDEFDSRIDFSQYRARLLELIKLTAAQKPLVAATRISERINLVTSSYNHAAVSAQDLALIESVQMGLETVAGAVFDVSAEFANSAAEFKFQIGKIFEGLLQQFLSLKWTEPEPVVIHARYLDSLGPFLKYNPDLVASVVNKLFELLTSLPCAIKDPVSSIARHARLQICTSFIRIAKAVGRSLLPHMKGIADTMAYLQGEGRLLRGEHNLLGEAFLVMASSSGIQQQQEVLAWLLEPLNKEWTMSEWQNAFLSDPIGLTRLCSDPQFMWSIYHTVTFFEKALKRSGIKKSTPLNLPGSSVVTDASTHPHPMAAHLSWMLPPLLRLMRCVHSLWSAPVSQALAEEIKAAKSMSHAEQAGLLGESNKLIKGLPTSADASQADTMKDEESSENDIRNWLKGIRDSGYNVIGLSTTIGDTFFQCVDGQSVALAMVENVNSMEFRHLRLLIHLVISPLVKFCPPKLWEVWIVNILHPLLLHCQQALTCSWSSLLLDGRAKVPDTFGNLSGLELKVEMMEEKLLRDLTREVCYLLSILASPPLNNGLPSLEHLGPNNRVDSLKDLNAFASNSMIGFLMMHKGLALPALRIGIDVLAWTDGEALTRAVPFCGSIVLLAIVTNSVELREFVAKDLFLAIIQALAFESNAGISSDLIGLCREIYVYLADRDPAPRQVLLTLPSITRDDLLAFEDALAKTTSPREQKQHIKSLLLLATGNKLRALAAVKSTNIITNVTARTRASASKFGQNIEEDDTIGLAAIT